MSDTVHQAPSDPSTVHALICVQTVGLSSSVSTAARSPISAALIISLLFVTRSINYYVTVDKYDTRGDHRTCSCPLPPAGPGHGGASIELLLILHHVRVNLDWNAAVAFRSKGARKGHPVQRLTPLSGTNIQAGKLAPFQRSKRIPLLMGSEINFL